MYSGASLSLTGEIGLSIPLIGDVLSFSSSFLGVLAFGTSVVLGGDITVAGLSVSIGDPSLGDPTLGDPTLGDPVLGGPDGDLTLGDPIGDTPGEFLFLGGDPGLSMLLFLLPLSPSSLSPLSPLLCLLLCPISLSRFSLSS